MLSASQANQQLARELRFVFKDVPVSAQPRVDFQQVRLDRGMVYYADALAWARLILEEESPLACTEAHRAPSLLFPMEALFEAFVAKHLARQLARPLILKTRALSHHLVRHREPNWFRLRPDLLIRHADHDSLVLDTKWKLLDALKANGTDEYGLSQSDIYQLQAYGQSYLDGRGCRPDLPENDRLRPTATGVRVPQAGGTTALGFAFLPENAAARGPE
jgi:5-methylcytosine-specific restriction enzyme subunit McrC